MERPSHVVALILLRQVADALLYLHASGVIHTAVTSHAVHLVAADFAKLGCLEHAVMDAPYSSAESTAPYCNAYRATYNWLAPELLLECGVVSRAVDVYSLGVLLWEVFSGRVPHDNLTPDEIFDLVTDGQLMSWFDLRVPSVLVDLLAETTRFQPDARPALEDIQMRLVQTFWAAYDQSVSPCKLSRQSM